MKNLYFRTQKISNRSLIWIAAMTFVALAMLRFFPNQTSDWERERMLEAAYQTQAAFDAIQCRRVELGQKMLKMNDPASTGMLGPTMSLVTTLPGHLDAKQTSVNPNFAAVTVRLLLDAGVEPGDCVAIGMTGSFPALDVAVLQACESLDVRPLVVSSAASSQYGANDPGMMWPDMEKILYDEGLLSQRSLLMSYGGFRDSAAGMSDDTRKLLSDAIKRNDCRLLRCDSLEESVEKRMDVFYASAASEPIKAYVNVGGGAASVGGTDGNDLFGSGLITRKQYEAMDIPDDCIAARFLKSDVPFINLINAVTLARRYGLVIAPTERQMVGESTVYHMSSQRRWLAALGIVLVLVTTWLAVKPPPMLVRKLRQWHWWPESGEEPQWMV